VGSSSGLIIAFVVAVWAAYFVPLVLRRYDEASKDASIDTSGSLGRVIARPATTAPAPATPAATVVVPADPKPAIDSAPAAKPVRTLDRPAARLAARRRRRTLLTLLALTVVVGGLAVFSVIAPLWFAAPVALVAAWLVACRVQVRGELGLARVATPKADKPPKAAKTAKPRKTPVAPAADEEETIIVSGQIEDINPGRKHHMEDVALEADALDDQIVIAVPSVSTTGEALWDPLPVTLPTYVTKPRAGRTVRTIDFGQAGAWTSGHIEGEDVELPQRSADAGEQRRATGT
jgi:hypothetical protein